MNLLRVEITRGPQRNLNLVHLEPESLNLITRFSGDFLEFPGY